MSKYKVWDKVLLQGKIEDIDNDMGDYFYWVKLADDTCDWISEKNMINNHKTYEDGLADAWELALKVSASEKYEGIPYYDCMEMFGTVCGAEIIRNNTPQQALAKIEAYEVSKQIQVGDVVYADNEPDSFGVVTHSDNERLYIMWNDGSCGEEKDWSDIRKAGRHIDIEHLLEQIRGDE